jgi:DNA-directed RNA polymerase alpha subunit
MATAKELSKSFISSRNDHGDKTYFQIENVNYSIVNALRRTIISDIPLVGFKTFPHNENEANFIKNTTRLNNEILKQRLSCIPVFIKDLTTDFRNLVVEIHKKNESESLEYVTTEDFRIKDISTDNYLSETATRRIFPPDPITEDYIIFCRLKPRISTEVPGEEINIEAKLSIRTAQENSAYNVVSTCAYGMTVDKLEQDNKWQEIQEKLVTEDMDPGKVELVKQNWYNHEGKRHTKKDSYDFIVETLGIYNNNEILGLACDILVEGLTNIMNLAQQDSLKIEKSVSTINNSYDIILPNIDYTLGKVVEYMLNEKFYKAVDTRHLSYVGFVKKHPHDSYSLIRMAFIDGVDMGGDFIALCRQDIQEACRLSKVIFKDIKDDFA